MDSRIRPNTKKVYIFAAAGQGAIYAMVSSWLLRYYTDVVGLELAFVTGLMWFAKLLNAVADPVIGVIVDKTHTKHGKMRPYLEYMPFIVSLLSLLLFVDFGIKPMAWRCIVCGVVYVVWGISYSVVDVPFWGLPLALSNDGTQRDKLFSAAKLLNSLGGALPTIIVSLLISKDLLGLQYGIFWGAVGIILLSAIPFSMVYHYSYEIPHTSVKYDKMSAGKQIKLICKNKILLLVVLCGFLGFGRYLIQAAYTYAASYVFISDSSFINNFSQVIGYALIGIGMFPTMIMAPWLVKKFSYKIIIIASGIGAAAIMTAFYFVEIATGYNFYWALLFLFLSGLPLGIFNIVVTSIVGECVDYLEWKEGVRLEGMTSSMSTFIAKVGNAISAGSIPMILMITGYVENVEQSASVKNWILILISLLPAASMLLCVVPMLFYDFVGDKRAKALAELEERRASENGDGTQEVLS